MTSKLSIPSTKSPDADRLAPAVLSERQTARDTDGLGTASKALSKTNGQSGFSDSQTDQEPWMRWPFNLQSYAPDLEYGNDVLSALRELESTLLSDQTAVQHLYVSESKIGVEDHVVDMEEMAKELETQEKRIFGFFFINRFLMKSNKSKIPRDPKNLRISGPALRLLLSHLEAPPAFVGSFSRYYQPAGRGCRRHRRSEKPSSFEFWYILPVRVQVECTDLENNHTRTTAGSNQMDPFHYLHLPNERLDIRGSQIGILFQYDYLKGSTTLLGFSFQDGRWSRVVEEPRQRIKEALERFGIAKCEEDPFFVHMAYLTSALRWWRNALDSFNNQLIAHEKRLQEQMGALQFNTGDLNNEISRALHTMTAHLHRYGSELGWLEDIVADISDHHNDFLKERKDRGMNQTESAGERIALGIVQIASQLKAVNSFRRELESKTQNILALLFNNIQVSNDKMVVANGEAMNKMLKAARTEAKISRRIADQSQQIALEMKEDSVAMKTIAILTMFFLPGTSFAAILAMPFLSQSAWMSKTSRIWLWVTLTIPTTILAFVFYAYWKRRQWRRRRPRKDVETGVIRMRRVSVEIDSDESQ